MKNVRDVDNQLMARMMPSDRTRLFRSGTMVKFDPGTELGTADGLIAWCWLPTNGLNSIISMDENGSEADVGVIGREGLIKQRLRSGRPSIPRVCSSRSAELP